MAVRHQRRTAQVAEELSRYIIDFAALSETRLPGEGSPSDLSSGYTFFWKGTDEEEDRIN
jgi:hypothetical protein